MFLLKTQRVENVTVRNVPVENIGVENDTVRNVPVENIASRKCRTVRNS